MKTSINSNTPLPWKDADKIIDNIRLPEIPSRDFNASDFACFSSTDVRPAILAAIEACSEAGGGTVVIPPGVHLCKGPIHLKNNINLHFSEGMFLKFCSNPENYLPSVYCRWEGVNLYNYSPMIYGNNLTDIAITGKGVIDGGAEIWSTYKYIQQESQNEARRMGEEGIPLEERHFGEGDCLRPSMLQLMHCKRILIEDVTLTNSPFWMIHPVYSEHITVRNTTCHSMFINNDGIDIDSCSEVLIENSSFSNGDDGIAMKAGRDKDAWDTGIPTRNVVIRNCEIPEALHGFAVGSEMSGGVEDVYVHNCRIGRINMEAIQFKSNKDRGGTMKNIFLSDITVESASNHFIYFTNDYHSYRGGDAPTHFSDITLENIHCSYAKNAIHLQGLDEKPIHDITFKNITVEKADTPVSSSKNTLRINTDHLRINGRDVRIQS